MSRRVKFYSRIDADRDCIERNEQIARIRAENLQRGLVEFHHFLNVCKVRFAGDKQILPIITAWESQTKKNSRFYKDPAYCKIQILYGKRWSEQETTDIEMMYNAFRSLNQSIWSAQEQYGENPKVGEFIAGVRKGSDIRVIPFQYGLQRIIKEEGLQ